MATVHVLANPAARGGRTAAHVASVIDAFRSRGIEVEQLNADTAEATETVAAGVTAAGAERLVVIGGDGMVHLAVQAVAHSNTILGIVPFGTGNDFAGGLGLPTDMEAAVDAALAEPTAIDLMQIGDRWAASVATSGFSVSVNIRANAMRWPRGASRYTLATLLELPKLRATDYQLTIDGVTHDLPAVLVTVANTSDFGGGMRITPAAKATDGFLDVTVVGDIGRLELLRWFRKVFDGSHLNSPKVTTLRGREITVVAPTTPVWADGEPICQSPVTIAAAPGALRLAGVGSVAS